MSSSSRAFAAAAIAASALVATGCVPMFPSGPMGSDEREVGDVSTVVLDTSGELTITEGDPNLIVHASENALSRLTSDVSDGALVLGVEPGFALGPVSARYELTLNRLATIEVNGSGDSEISVPGDSAVRVEVNGSGDVSWADLSGDRVEVRVAGSGDVRLSGSAAELTVEIDGSGDVDADALTVRDAAIVIRGSGGAAVSAEDHLGVQIAGSGRVTYSGDPELDTDIWGSGEVVRG